MEKKIDILIATYNGEKYIKEQIDSILNQTYKNTNIIICDDKSTDNTITIIREYLLTHKNIKLYENEHNVGYIKNFEKLISLSTSPYFMLADQDDIWLEDKVMKSYKALIENNVDLVFTDLRVVNNDMEIIQESFNLGMGLNPNRINNKENIFIKNYVTGCTSICNASIKKDLIPFIDLDEKAYIHDWLMLIVSSLRKGFYYLDEVTILYRQHDNNSVGYKYQKKVTFKDKLNHARKIKYEFIESRLEFFSKLNLKYNNQFSDYTDYLNSIKKTKFINFEFKQFLIYFSAEKPRTKFIYFVIFHLPMHLLRFDNYKLTNYGES